MRQCFIWYVSSCIPIGFSTSQVPLGADGYETPVSPTGSSTDLTAVSLSASASQTPQRLQRPMVYSARSVSVSLRPDHYHSYENKTFTRRASEGDRRVHVQPTTRPNSPNSHLDNSTSRSPIRPPKPDDSHNKAKDFKENEVDTAKRNTHTSPYQKYTNASTRNFDTHF